MRAERERNKGRRVCEGEKMWREREKRAGLERVN